MADGVRETESVGLRTCVGMELVVRDVVVDGMTVGVAPLVVVPETLCVSVGFSVGDGWGEVLAVGVGVPRSRTRIATAGAPVTAARHP